MTILVTGGAGYIGSHMTHAIVDSKEKVVVLDDLSTGAAGAAPTAAVFVQGDIADQELILRLVDEHKIDSIVHFAAKSVVPDSVRDPDSYYHTNVVKTHALLSASMKAGVKRFIFSSTAAVYGAQISGPVTEDAPIAPQSPYGASKAMSERILCDVAGSYGAEYMILRYFNVAGADPLGRVGQSTPNATHLIKVAVQAAVGARQWLEIYGEDYPTPDGTCVRDYIHVSDLVDAHAAALAYLRAGGKSLTLNCGYGRGYSVREVVAAVRKVSGVDFKVRYAPRRAGDVASVVASNDRLRSALDWRPRFADLEVIVAHALAWEKQIGRSSLSPALAKS